MFCQKQSSKVITYRNYKTFLNESFRTDLINDISSNGILKGDLTGFFCTCKKLLDCRQASRKKKNTRANQAPFLTKVVKIVPQFMFTQMTKTNSQSD